MSRHLRGLIALGSLSVFVAMQASAQEEKVANPYYKFWASHKPGATAVHVEKTKLTGPEGKLVPGGVDEKRIAYKLIEVDKDHAVVEQVVTEQDFLGYVQAAPTRYIYPAMIQKSHLERIIVDKDAKKAQEAVKIGGKDISCKTIAGIFKAPDGEQVEFKLWLSEDVPGSIVKQVRTTRQKGELIAETTSTLQKYKN